MFFYRSALLVSTLLGIAYARPSPPAPPAAGPPPPGPPGPPARGPAPPGAPPPGPPPRQKIVPGRAFDRFVSIWLENTDFADALADPNLSALAAQGILLNNYFALTHPSEPNYVAHVGGDYFGMNNDALNDIPTNISSVADLLDDKGISWGEYQEDMPVSGFAGFQFLNPVTGANDYVRKHDPLIIFDNVANDPVRAAKIKNFTLFDVDLANNALPQWMFITPNMTDDGHDTNVTVAGAFSHRFLTPLLTNPNFNDKNTLILLTFDENENNAAGNKVWAILLGNAVPPSLRGSIDNTFYTHYSAIASIEANWNLHHLGRYDVSANPFAIVAERTGERLRSLPASVTADGGPLLNGSYPGVFNNQVQAPLPIPNTRIVVNGRTILPKIRDVWGAEALQRCTVYSDNNLLPPFILSPPVLPQGC